MIMMIMVIMMLMKMIMMMMMMIMMKFVHNNLSPQLSNEDIAEIFSGEFGKETGNDTPVVAVAVVPAPAVPQVPVIEYSILAQIQVRVLT